MTLSKSAQNKLFQLGYTAKGIVYSLMGIFAVATVIGAARSDGGGGPKAVIEWIGSNPFGQILLLLLALGLLAYCAWRLYKAVADTENEGHDGSGIVKRIGWAVSGFAYGSLSFYAFKLLIGNDGGSGGKKQDIIARILQQSWGPMVVGVIAAIVAGMGIYQLYRAITAKHMDGVEGQGLSEDQRKIFKTTGQVGLCARFVIYGVIAYFLTRAALMDDASQFKGIGESLNYLENQTLGVALVSTVGAGLLAYGIFMFVRVKYERV